MRAIHERRGPAITTPHRDTDNYINGQGNFRFSFSAGKILFGFFSGTFSRGLFQSLTAVVFKVNTMYDSYGTFVWYNVPWRSDVVTLAKSTEIAY